MNPHPVMAWPDPDRSGQPCTPASQPEPVSALDRPSEPTATPVPDRDPEHRKVYTDQAAQMAGVKPSTWRSWRTTGHPRPEPPPDPDGWDDLRIPWWWEPTITAWVERRTAVIAARPARRRSR